LAESALRTGGRLPPRILKNGEDLPNGRDG